jgi:crossover junction endodeoxyribonuclease RuvC
MGIDPGTICCGYGIVEVREMEKWRNGEIVPKSNTPTLQYSSNPLVYVASGEIRMNKKDALPERLKILYNSLKEIFNEYKPSHLCIEKIFYHKSIHSTLTLGSMRGVALLLAAENALPVFEYNPTKLKMALTGYGRAEKQQVREMVIRILNLHPPVSPLTKGGMEGGWLSEDSSDALALCICHINHSSNKLK